MTREYIVYESGAISYEENGVLVSFLPDPANSDYQIYLASLEEDQAQTATI